MATTEEKIALIVEAVNKFKGTFDELQKNLNDVDSGHKKIGAGSDSVFRKLKENWVAISVAVAEVGMAVREVWDYMAEGAKAQQAEESFRAVAAAAHESADDILESMRRAANGTMDDSAMMQKAVKGMIQGLSGDQMVHIMDAARLAARTSGEDVQTAFENITDAIANKMPRSLQRYGLVTKEQVRLLNEAMAMGVTEVDLYAIAMENAGRQIEKHGQLADNNAEKMQQWKAWFNELRETIGKGIFWLMDNALNPLLAWVETLATTFARAFGRIGALWDWMKTMVSGLWNWIKSGFTGSITDVFSGATNNLYKDFANLDTAFDQQMSEIVNRYQQRAGEVPGPGKNFAQKKTTGPTSGGATEMLRGIVGYRAQVQALEDQLADLDSLEKTRAVDHLEAARERVAYEQQILDYLQKQYNARDAQGKFLISDPNARANLLKQIDDAKKKITDFKLALRDLDGTFRAGFTEGLQQYVDQVGSTFQQAEKLAQETAQAMQQAFSDFFFDIMQGKFKSLWDYIKNFLTAVERSLANMLAQQTAQGISSAIVSWLGGSGSVAGSTGGTSGAIAFAHSGGLIMHAGGYVPRFHVGGLSSDEVPAILQKGEYVVSRKGVAALDRINGGDAGGGRVSVVVQVENRSSQPVQGKQGASKFDGKSLVVGVVLEDIENGGPIRTAIGGMRT